MAATPKPRSRTRTAILDAAAAAFNELGFERASMEEIARRAEVARGTLYYNFASKDDIAVGIAERYRAEGYARLLEQRAAGIPALELFDRFFAFAGAWIATNRDAALIGTTAAIKGLGRTPGRPGTTAVFLDLIGQGQREGSLRPDLDPQVTARLLTSLLTQAALFGPEHAGEAAEWPRRLLHAALRGLATPEAVA